MSIDVEYLLKFAIGKEGRVLAGVETKIVVQIFCAEVR